MSFSLASMVWFFLMHCLRERIECQEKLPCFCRYLVLQVICYLFCIKKYKTVKVPRSKEGSKNNKTSKNHNFPSKSYLNAQFSFEYGFSRSDIVKIFKLKPVLTGKNIDTVSVLF